MVWKKQLIKRTRAWLIFKNFVPSLCPFSIAEAGCLKYWVVMLWALIAFQRSTQQSACGDECGAECSVVFFCGVNPLRPWESPNPKLGCGTEQTISNFSDNWNKPGARGHSRLLNHRSVSSHQGTEKSTLLLSDDRSSLGASQPFTAWRGHAVS